MSGSGGWKSGATVTLFVMLTTWEREELAGRISRSIHHIAHRHHPMIPLDADDLYQEGMVRVLALLDRMDSPPADWLEWRSAAMSAANFGMVDAIRKARWGRKNKGGVDGLPPPLHLEAITNDDGDPLLGDLLADPNVDIEGDAVRQARVREAVAVLCRMGNRRRAQMIALWANGASMTQIADRYGVTESRVSQIIDLGGSRVTR